MMNVKLHFKHVVQNSNCYISEQQVHTERSVNSYKCCYCMTSYYNKLCHIVICKFK